MLLHVCVSWLQCKWCVVARACPWWIPSRKRQGMILSFRWWLPAKHAQMYSMTSCSWGNFRCYAALKRIESKQAAIDFSTSRVNAASSPLFTAQTIDCQRQMSPCLLLSDTEKMAASVEELLVFVFFLQVYWHKRYMYSECLPDSYHLHTAVWRKLCVRRVTLQQSKFFFNLLFSFCIHIPSPLVCLFAWKAVYFCF